MAVHLCFDKEAIGHPLLCKFMIQIGYVVATGSFWGNK